MGPLNSLLKKFIPTKILKPLKHKPWITRDIRTIIHRIHRRNGAYNSWKSQTVKTFKNTPVYVLNANIRLEKPIEIIQKTS